MAIDNTLWLQVKDILKSNTDSSVFNQTYAPITEVYKEQNNCLYLIVNNAYEKYRLEKFYLEKMNQVLLSLTGNEKKFVIITKDERDLEEQSKVATSLAQQQAQPIQVSSLREEYTFENFVTGEANREAFTYAVKVAESPHSTINPFYIFGDVGLGKTHLMISIGHYILKNNPKANIVYTTALQFLEDYVKAKSKSQKDPNASIEFDNYYRSADVLLVDDIQYLENKQGLQDEFFKLFEILFGNKKQIVVTSDKQASELNIMARLKSRFSWGIQADIRKPNLELRTNILKKKVSSFSLDESQVDIDALDYIAKHFADNLRDLEGALRRFISYCVSFNLPFTLENAKISLETLIQGDSTVTPEIDNRQIEKIKEAVAVYFNMDVRDLASKSRRQEYVYARDLCIYLLKTTYNVTLSQIGYYFGGRDHSTISHSIDKTDERVKNDEFVRNDIENIKKVLNKKAE